ncbi:MAG TPA: cytosine permease [Actinomycetota bacterium]|nr:cytosine permease [Actinomycetota bacterium]
MTTAAERLERALEREAPAWGIRPVPPEQRRLRGFDFAVLWGDLAIGLLVMLTGALLVPALGLPEALAAIVVGSVLGCIPLALVGVAGAREGVPGMVLFRPVLGVRGSFVPSVLNIVTLVGWTGFELWAMSLVANRVWHLGYGVWLAVVAVVCTALALGGPIVVIRRWLERFGAWVIGAVGLWITVRVLTHGDLSAMWNAPGKGGLHFLLAVDLVIVMPVSWLPLVADYNRFARRGVTGAVGTFAGYAIGNAWFYSLGAMLVLVAGPSGLAGPGDLGTAIASVAGGWVVLLALLVGETDEAFADIYSSAVSAQNLSERVRQRPAVLCVAVAGVGLAAWLGGRPSLAVGNYEQFLFLLGSVFVPLFGVFVADHFVLRNRPSDLFAVDALPSFRWRAVVPWVVGFLLYQWSVPTALPGWEDGMRTLFHSWLGLPFPLAGSALGASVPSFLVALLVSLVVLDRPGSRRSSVESG